MKKLILVLAILVIAAPAFAALDVNLVRIGTTNQVLVRYTGASSSNLPRAFALVIEVNSIKPDVCGVTNYKTGESNSTTGKGYGIYPAKIVITSGGSVTSWGDPIADQNDPLPAGADQILPSNKLVLEFGSLYPVRDLNNAPATDGNLCSLIIDPNTAAGNFDIKMTGEVTYRGGVVLEDGTTVAVNKTLVYTQGVTDCYVGMADYAQFVEAGSPSCWCKPRQCHGDADGLMAGDSKNGYWAVGALDLSILTSGWLVKNSPRGPGITSAQACADFDHLKAGDSKNGYWRVGALDLSRLTSYWLVKQSPRGPGVPGDCYRGIDKTP